LEGGGESRNIFEQIINTAVWKCHYQRRDIDHLPISTCGAMEGCESVEDYEVNGIEIPGTAPMREGKSYKRGNYYNATQRFTLTSVYRSDSEHNWWFANLMP